MYEPLGEDETIVQIIAGLVFDVAEKFWYFWFDYKNTWIIGTTVASWSLAVSVFLYTLYLKLWDFDTEHEGVLGDIYDLLRGVGLFTLIEGLWSDWEDIVDDPEAYIVGKVTGWWEELVDLADAPASTIEGWLEDRWDWLEDLIDDPGAWVLDKIDTAWPAFATFRADPSGEIAAWLTEKYEALPEVLTDPRGWVEGELEDMLDVDPDFWDDPWGAVVEKAQGVIEDRMDYMRRWFWEQGEALLYAMFERGKG